jgi:hypothetical protein
LDLHHRNHNDGNDAEDDEIHPPEALAVSRAGTLLGLGNPILGLGHVVLLRHVKLLISFKAQPLNRQEERKRKRNEFLTGRQEQGGGSDESRSTFNMRQNEKE